MEYCSQEERKNITTIQKDWTYITFFFHQLYLFGFSEFSDIFPSKNGARQYVRKKIYMASYALGLIEELYIVDKL